MAGLRSSAGQHLIGLMSNPVRSTANTVHRNAFHLGVRYYSKEKELQFLGEGRLQRIFLVRHGQSEGNVDPSLFSTIADHAMNLSPDGVDQAKECGRGIRQYYQSLNLDAVPNVRMWVSPYARTRQTAELLAGQAGDVINDIKEHPFLVEQDHGLFAGLGWDEAPEKYPEAWTHYQRMVDYGGAFWARVPLGESRFDVCRRVHQAFGTFQRDSVGLGEDPVTDIICVTHGVAFRAFLMMWFHHTYEWFEREPNPNNCAVRLIELDGERDPSDTIDRRPYADRGYIFPGYKPNGAFAK